MMMRLLLPWRSLQAQYQILLIIITPHGAVQLLCWNQYCKATYLDYPIEHLSLEDIYLGKSPFHAGSVYIVLNQETCIFYLNLMWSLMMNFPQLHSWGKSKYLQIGQILCNTAHTVAHRRILTSGIIGSIQIFNNIP